MDLVISVVPKKEDVHSPFVEGEPYYCLRKISIGDQIKFSVRSFEELPFDDAVGLLSGNDQTGLILWSGSLAFIRFLAAQFYSHANTIPTVLPSPEMRERRHVVVELGSGSGILSVAVASMLAARGVRSDVILTDKNPECLHLMEVNITQLSRDLKERNHASDLVHAWSEKLEWEEEKTPTSVADRLSSAAQDNSRVVVLCADVLYGFEAVAPLVRTVHRLFDCLIESGALHGDSLEWWLWYVPRCLRVSENKRVWEKLLEEIHQREWQCDIFDEAVVPFCPPSSDLLGSRLLRVVPCVSSG